VELASSFKASLQLIGINGAVLGADVLPSRSSACQFLGKSFAVPRCDDPSFISKVLSICERNGIDLVIPTIDTELLVYSEALARFAEIGVKVAVSKPNVIKLARDKVATMSFLARNNIPIPRSLPMVDFLESYEDWEWPVLLKPLGGSSSVGLHIASDVESVRSLDVDPSQYIVQDYCQGEEYTVNMFFDQDSNLRTVVPHLRLETRGGEVSKGVTARVPKLIGIGRDLGAALVGARGALCFQAIVDESGDVAVFEINARFGGGYPIAHHAGAEFSTWLLQECAGLPCSAHDDWREGVMMLRYDQSVFL